MKTNLQGKPPFFLALFIVLTFGLPSNSFATDNPRTIFDVLSHSEMVELTLTMDLDQLINNVRTIDYLPAVLTHKDSEGKELSFNLKVRARGKFRRRVCDFPPLKLNFSEQDLKTNQLKGYDKLKLVTHCLSDRILAHENVLREYLAYKLYNEINEDNSYRVQLVKITYKDSYSNKKLRNRYGFLIENNNELASRLGGDICSCMNAPTESFSKKSETQNALFQYMIGNQDWDVVMLRNVKLISVGDENLVIPFDFDFSGFVNAPYARPNPDFELVSIKDRIFLGHALPAKVLMEQIAYFKTKKSALFKIVNEFDYLSNSSRKSLLRYLREFYTIIENEESVKQEFKLTPEPKEATLSEKGITVPIRPVFNQ